MVCRNCGNPLVPDALFCGVCGTRVAVENPAAPVAAAVEETVQSAAAAVEETVQPAVAAVEETVAPVAAAAEAPAAAVEEIAAPVTAAAEAPAAAVEEIAAPVAAAVEENVQTAAESVAAPVVETAAPIVEAAAPAATAVEAVKAAAEETVPPVYQQPVAPAAPEAPVAPQPVYQQPVYQQPAAPAAPQAAPEAPAAPQQPVYQQPVYQQPVAPGMPQAGQQPVYQQPGFPQAAPQQGFPQQPVYAQPGYPQQPVFQQPAPAKKKKSKAPVIIISILLILLILAGSGIAYLTFFDKNGEKNYFGIDLNVLDFTQLSDSEEKAFLEKIETIDEAFAEVNARKFKKALPDFAVKYACEIFGAKDVPTLLEDSYEKYLEEACGEVSSVSEKAYLKYEIDSPKKLAESVEELMGGEVTMKKAYLVENVSKYKGDKGTKSMSDLYIFYNDGEEWNVILIDESTVEKLNID